MIFDPSLKEKKSVCGGVKACRFTSGRCPLELVKIDLTSDRGYEALDRLGFVLKHIVIDRKERS